MLVPGWSSLGAQDGRNRWLIRPDANGVASWAKPGQELGTVVNAIAGGVKFARPIHGICVVSGKGVWVWPMLGSS